MGESLPVESELTEQLGASRSVIREGLRILETEGMVEVRRGPGGGPRVTHPSIVTVAQAVGVHLQLQAVSVMDVWEAYGQLVLSAIGQLARASTPDAIGAIAVAIDALESKVGTRSDYALAVTEVAEEIVRQAANTTQLLLASALKEVIASELSLADQRVGYAKTDAQARIVLHLRTVLKHIAAGRHEAARRAYQQELDRIAAGLRRLLPGATVVDVFPWRMP
jgi:DNA-binding FadR family transcriptional regulator